MYLLSRARELMPPTVFFISFLPDVNFLIRDLPNMEMSPKFRKTPRFWTFQNFDSKISATFSEIFWIEKEKIAFEKNTEQKVYIWRSDNQKNIVVDQLRRRN